MRNIDIVMIGLMVFCWPLAIVLMWWWDKQRGIDL